jgi:putative aldouronate transport system substrate-binding protein
MRKRALLVLVILLFSLSTAGVFAGGAGETAAGGPAKFTYLAPVYGPSTWRPDSDFAKIFFKYANVQIDIHGIGFLDYIQQFPTVVAGGALPDLFWHNGPTIAPAYDIISQGGAVALDGLLDNYPNLKNAMPKEYWDLGRSPDGKIYSMPIGNVVVPYVPFGIRYRKDLFDKYNLGVPKTLDEFVQDIKTIMKNEPTVTIGLSADYYDPWAFQNLGPAFGYGFSNWIPAPGESKDNPTKIIPSNVAPEYKEFLRFMNQLRKDGIMDPDFMLVKGTGGDDKFKKGQAVAIMGGWWAYLDELKIGRAHV